MNLNHLLQSAVGCGASDVLLVCGAPPVIRVAGRLQPMDYGPLDSSLLEELCRQAMTDEQRETFAAQRDVDFSMSVPELGRFRFNVHRQRESYAAAIRYIAQQAPALETLNLPPAVERLTRLPQGLVLVTGQTGSGKSTTLAALIERINHRDAKHIITLEDPIEYQFTHGRSLIEQREIGADCPSFASGLKHVLRQDPDVILVGELRDLETIRTALQAAETGHLVLATLHSSTAAGAVDRMIEVFPPDGQAQIRAHLAESLKAVVTQRLVPLLEGGGRAVAAEILIVTRAVQTAIREATLHLIPGMISTGRRLGMQTMEQALKELVLNGLIATEVLDEALGGGE